MTLEEEEKVIAYLYKTCPKYVQNIPNKLQYIYPKSFNEADSNYFYSLKS